MIRRKLFQLVIKILDAEEFIERINELEDNLMVLIEELGGTASFCDKCNGDVGDQCLKCRGKGVVKKKQLMDWPWP